MKALTAAQMREADRLTTERYGIPGSELMENAGMAIAEFLRDKFPNLAGRKILILCGKGNNGGDGMVVARLLKEFRLHSGGFSVRQSGSPRGRRGGQFETLAAGAGRIVCCDQRSGMGFGALGAGRSGLDRRCAAGHRTARACGRIAGRGDRGSERGACQPARQDGGGGSGYAVRAGF